MESAVFWSLPESYLLTLAFPTVTTIDTVMLVWIEVQGG